MVAICASIMARRTGAEAAMIRTALEQGGELSAAIELRRLFRGIGSNEVAREYARIIAGWRSLSCLLPDG